MIRVKISATRSAPQEKARDCSENRPSELISSPSCAQKKELEYDL